MISDILYVILAIVILGVIVTAHEFGHYIVGRLCGFGINEFSVGMGPAIISKEHKGIKYSLRCIPIGGYCAFLGEDEENPDPRALNNQPVWKRFAMIVSGPLMNFVLGFILCVVLLCGYFYVGTIPVLDSVSAGMPAEAAGLMAGDTILAYNGEEVSYDTEGVSSVVTQMRALEEGASVELTVKHKGSDAPETLTLTPVAVQDASTGETVMQVGIVFTGVNYSIGQAIGESFAFTADTLKLMLQSLRDLVFKGKGLEDTAGPVGIITLVSQQARNGLYTLLYLMFIITLNLGLMNLLPLPALDGGRLMFCIIEAIRGKPVPPEKEGLVHTIGFILLLVLMLALTYNDIARLLHGGFNF